jgi:vacuolar-type H+-ATPase subunit I/STV1
VEENNRLRNALNADSEFSFERMQLNGNRAENYERYLDVKNEEISELKTELAAYKRELDDYRNGK